MGLQEIQISFKKRAEMTVNLLASGRIGIVLKQQESEQAITQLFKFKNLKEAERIIKEKKINLTEDSKKCLDLVFRGNVYTPAHVVVGIVKNDDSDFDFVLDLFNSAQFEFICAPEFATSKSANLTDFIAKYNKKGEAIYVGTTSADSEFCINFATDNVVVREVADVKNVTFSKDLFTARIASFLAGTPLTQSVTNFKIEDVVSIPARTQEELNTDVDNGRLVLFTDWENIRFGRGVNSLLTIENKSEELKKIITVAKMNVIKKQMKEMINEYYLGKVMNNLDGKMLLIASLNQYLLELENRGILFANQSTVDIDIQAQKNYLVTHGVDVDGMTEQEIRNANTTTFVFLAVNLMFTDAMEDVFIEITY